jgi:D-inositol-3-phosphate glycosyltransferase
LVDGHNPADWAAVIGGLLAEPARRAELARGAVAHAHDFSWDRTAAGLLAVYRSAVLTHHDERVSALAPLRPRAALDEALW